MFRRVAGDVVAETSGEQQPEVLIRLTREFYMKEEAVEVEPSVAVAETSQVVATAETPPAPTTGIDAAGKPAAPPIRQPPQSPSLARRRSRDPTPIFSRVSISIRRSTLRRPPGLHRQRTATRRSSRTAVSAAPIRST